MQKPTGRPREAKGKTTAHSVYNLNYPIVFVTKYRNQVLTGAIEQHIKEQMPLLCQRYGVLRFAWTPGNNWQSK